jgi:hypothetical protein
VADTPQTLPFPLFYHNCDLNSTGLFIDSQQNASCKFRLLSMKAFFISYHQGFQFTSISTSLLASGAYLIWVPSTVFMRLRSSTALGSIINGSWINFTKKDDHFSISTLFSSLKDILHSMVNVSILFRIVLTSNQPCL